MPDFRPATAHGELTEVFADVFFVQGTLRIGPGVTIGRNMTVVRQGAELVVVNPVRLSPEGEAALEKLGKVAHVLRIAAFHGADDPYFVHRFGATLWAPPGTKVRGRLPTRDLVPGSSPIDGATIFAFEKGAHPEVAVVLANGAIVAGDSYQNWTTFAGCSLLGKWAGRALGLGPTVIGGPWTRAMGQAVRADFDRLRALPFAHLLPSHGDPIQNEAKPGLAHAIAHRFGG